LIARKDERLLTPPLEKPSPAGSLSESAGLGFSAEDGDYYPKIHFFFLEGNFLAVFDATAAWATALDGNFLAVVDAAAAFFLTTCTFADFSRLSSFVFAMVIVPFLLS
jgi:hypothetical protein